jgi:enamine deaminase RidA (YjgF/YER057c/UK114 family)
MPRKRISTVPQFEQKGGYSRAIVDGDFCFVAGTTGYDYATMQIPDDIVEQTRNAFHNIESVLQQAGFAMADIVRATYYLTDMTEADKFIAVCGEIFRDIRPASTLLGVTALYKPEMRVEIEVTAKRSALD